MGLRDGVWPEMQEESLNKTENFVRELIGLELAGVTFIRDYYQFAFDGPSLSLFNDITIEVKNEAMGADNIAFYAGLVNCIGNKVVDIAIK
jgi:hypothetical protein